MYARKAAIGAALLALVSVAQGGHELPVYPSYYPHEIVIATATPATATAPLRDGKMHAYVGRGVAFAPSPPASVDSVPSLGAFVVVRVKAGSALARGESACAALAAVVAEMGHRGDGLILHPYPVTPYHGDYLYHADLAEAAKTRLLAARRAPLKEDLKVAADGELLRGLVRPEWLVVREEADLSVEEIDARDLIASAAVMTNAWLGPEWIHSGWFHAYRLLNGAITDVAAKQELESKVKALEQFRYESQVERINLERDVVAALTTGCQAIVAGYTIKREYYNDEFSAGVENIGYDAIDGLSSPMFLRTVKLKDFPWNGWLQVGIDAEPGAAWNPVAGFNDRFGRLMWYGLADPAVVPFPYGSGWMLNRFADVQVAPR
jgi:hypothetical protein